MNSKIIQISLVCALGTMAFGIFKRMDIMHSLFQGVLVFSGSILIMSIGMSMMREGIIFMNKPVEKKELEEEKDISTEEVE